jgi:peptide/nickel transport system substrate-binding protein
MSILPAHLLANLHDINHAAYNIKPVGTGPFIVKSFDPSSGVVLTANPNYWRGAPRLREIDYLIVPDANTRAVMMKTGEADLYYDPPSSLQQDLSAIAGVHVLNTTFSEYWYLEFNTMRAHAPLDDARVRRAITMGVDRDYIVRTVMRGAAVLSDQTDPNSAPIFNITRFDFDSNNAPCDVLVEALKVKAPAIARYSLAKAGDALEKSAGGHARGKLVVTV